MRYVNKLDSNKRIIYFFIQKQTMFLKNLFFKNNKNKHLFILSPPFCGSTLLSEIISTSNNVSCNNNIGLREGQHIPEVSKLIFTEDRWDPKKEIDWALIHSIWNKYWDRSKNILLEKSPPNICRANDIEKQFKDIKFICLIRNPYAQIEGKIRRHKITSLEAVRLTISYFKMQKENITKLNNVLLINYEDLTEKSETICQKIIEFIPEIGYIYSNITSKAHNYKGIKNMSIKNLNKDKIDNLTKKQIKEINSLLEKEKDLMDFFNYQIIKY